MLFLIDGYNVTKGDPATKKLTLEQQRDALVARLRARGRDLLGAGTIAVVFDGDVGLAAQQVDTHPVIVEFSRGGTADDAIVRVVRRAPDAQVCLVTSDRGLADRVRAHLGAEVDVRARESVYEATRPARRRQRRGRPGAGEEPGIPAGGRAITKELEALWGTDKDGE